MLLQEVTLHSQSTLNDFIEKMPPSIKFKTLTCKFEKIMKFNHFFSQSDKMIEYLLQTMEVFTSSSQQTLVAQGDLQNHHIYIIGDGVVEVTKKMDTINYELICELEAGSIVNDIAALFDCPPVFHYETKTYCTLARIQI